MKKHTALVLTHSGDYFTVDRVLAALEEAGVSALRINTDVLGTDARLQLEFPRRRVRINGVELTRVKGIWARRVWAPLPPPGLSESASDAQVTALISGLELVGARWVNPWTESQAAESKPRQLALATRLGLKIPPTLITADAREVKAFRAQHGRVISKLLVPTVQTMQADARFIYTAEVEGPLEPFWEPRIFQPLIPKAREVRMICVGNEVFAGSVDPTGIKHAEVDWRRLTRGDGVSWQPEKIPAVIKTRTLKLLRTLGLVYGACDFIVTPKNEWFFLEVNPAGEYGWLERDLQLPISQAIADAMLDTP